MPPANRIANEIIRLIQTGQAFTDLNIRPGRPIAYRAPAGYRPMSEEGPTPHDMKEFCELADGQWEKRIDEGGGQFDAGITLKGEARLRCNIFRYGNANEVGIIARKLAITPPNIDQIGVAPELKRILSSQPKGLLLISGPTGSGKSTTLAAIVEYFNETQPIAINTIEDPIEYEFVQKKAQIIQREVPKNVASFKLGVESAKRQDPDVILVGEARDKGTVEAMLMASTSGHLVLATTHARSVQEAIESVLAYFKDEELAQKRGVLANSLLAVQSQVLLPSIDGSKFVLGYELMMNNPQIATFLRDGRTKDIGALIQTSAGKTNGVVSLNERLLKMVEAGHISKEAAIASAYDKNLGAKLLGSSAAGSGN